MPFDLLLLCAGSDCPGAQTPFCYMLTALPSRLHLHFDEQFLQVEKAYKCAGHSSILDVLKTFADLSEHSHIGQPPEAMLIK